MPKRIPWTRSIKTKLAALTLGFLALSAALIAGNLYILSLIRGDAAMISLAARGPFWLTEMLYLANQYGSETGERRAVLLSNLRRTMERYEQRFRQLREGDARLGVPPVDDPALLQRIEAREEAWRTQIRPRLERIQTAVSVDEAYPLIREVEEQIIVVATVADDIVDHAQSAAEAEVDAFQTLQYVFGAAVVALLLVLTWFARSLIGRIRNLAATADEIAAGDLGLRAPVDGRDELAVLGESFNTMTATLHRTLEAERKGVARLEELLAAIADTTNRVSSAAAEILAGTSQQASGAQEQAAAVAQTVSTVDEVLQTSEQAAERAREVATSSQRAAEIGKTGRRTVDESIAAMDTVKEQSESIAESILALAERAQAIGEIIATVNEIAEQTNLLALNAGIEAARAGEQGAGFAVVAREIRELADQARKATAQVRQILGEIQKATNSAVMVTEEGTKSMSGAAKAIAQAGEIIRSLEETIGEAARAGSQIAASAGQQATGMAQIQQAMKDINQTTHQTLAATKQSEHAAHDLDALGGRLKELVAGRRT